MCIILFDIDGTLTKSTKIISSDMINTLLKLKNKPNIKLGLVGGGTFEKIKYQMNNIIHIFKYIFAESGAVIYVDGKKVLEKNMLDYCDNVLLDNIKMKASNIISNIEGLPIHTTKLDQRNGLLYISIPGMGASDKERNDFIELNNQNGIKKYILDELKCIDKDSQLNIAYGGEVGIQVSPLGFDKSQAIHYLIENDLNEPVYYFGDRTEPDGNDYPIYIHERVNGFKVNDYFDTINQLESLFNF